MFYFTPLPIPILSIFRFDCKLLFIGGFYSADDLGVDIEALADLDYGFGGGLVGINLHTMPHIKHLIHLLPRRLRLLLYHLEQGRDWEEVVFDYVVVVYKVKDLGLGS